MRSVSTFDFHLVVLLKGASKTFANIEKMKKTVQVGLRDQPREFLANGIRKLYEIWDKTKNVEGDYVGELPQFRGNPINRSWSSPIE